MIFFAFHTRIVYSTILFVILCAHGFAVAKPADSRPRSVLLPDSSSLTLQQWGNELFHWRTTLDGYPIHKGKDGFYYYLNAEGSPSTQRARNLHERSEVERSFVQFLNPRLILQSLRPTPIAPRQTSTQYKPSPWAGTAPSSGVHRGLVILVEFADSTFQLSNPREEYQLYMNHKGYNHYGMHGSVRDYFLDNSLGALELNFDVFGPVRLSKPASYYGGNGPDGIDSAVAWMVYEATRALDSQIDFRLYDSNKDGYVDFVYLFYAGKGEADGGEDYSIFPQSAQVNPFTLDQVKISLYATSNETSGSAIEYALDGIGTFCHEFAHVLGLPDVYDTDGSLQGDAFTANYWDLMDAGVYNCANNSFGNSSCSPPLLSALQRYTLGWIDPEELVERTQSYVLAELSQNQAFRISANPDYFYLLENRQQRGWDAALPGHGMLIWRIDYDSTLWASNQVNQKSNDLHIDLWEADGIANLATLAGDPFPGQNEVRQMLDFRNAQGDLLLPGIWQIQEQDERICFTTTPTTIPIDCNPYSSSSTSTSSSSFLVSSSSSPPASSSSSSSSLISSRLQQSATPAPPLHRPPWHDFFDLLGRISRIPK